MNTAAPATSGAPAAELLLPEAEIVEALPGRAGHRGHESAAGRNVRFMRCAASGTQSPVSGSRRISGPS